MITASVMKGLNSMTIVEKNLIGDVWMGSEDDVSLCRYRYKLSLYNFKIILF